MPEKDLKAAAGHPGSSDAAGENRVAGVVPVPPGDVEPQTLRFDESALVADYTNFVRVMGTAEEVILDLGLNKQSPKTTAVLADTVAVHRRIVVSYYTAKRLFHAVTMAVQRHEANFGRLETDVRSRLRGKPRQD